MKISKIDYATFRIADSKFRKGDHITDSELKMLLGVYNVLANHLVLLGDYHIIGWRDINMQKLRLKDMQKARKK